jgi:hypothetical protein
MGEGTATQAGNKRRMQIRAARKDGFTDAKRQTFLDHLAGCSNVTRAAAAAGVSPVTVNYHRRRDAGFAAQCAEALETGYDALEAALVERAATGGGGYVPGPDADAAPGPDSVDTALALHLLSLRKAPGVSRTGRAGRPPGRASEAELNAAILAKLEVLDRRLKAGRPLGFRGKKGTVAKGGGA